MHLRDKSTPQSVKVNAKSFNSAVAEEEQKMWTISLIVVKHSYSGVQKDDNGSCVALNTSTLR